MVEGYPIVREASRVAAEDPLVYAKSRDLTSPYIQEV